jgi:hypothetical protein
MTNIIQSVSITKHINPSKQISDEYTLMIGYHDVIYISKIKQEDFNSVLFEFDMLENLIYNCNHKQKVGDICCDMTISESESFGKILDITLLFERDVKPMKKINEKHGFQLQEKKLDYDDKIGLAMTNLRNEINFVEIKPTTKIIFIDGSDNTNKYNTNIDSELTKLLSEKYIDNIKLYSKTDDLLLIGSYYKCRICCFIDETKKPNNRKIKFYKNIEEFIKNRKQFKSYHILDMQRYGILIEEIE